MSVSIYLVEDHPVMRQMLQVFIARMPGHEVCGVAGSGEEALDHLPEAEADLVLIDLSLPEMSGIDLITEIRGRWPALQCLILSGHKEASYVQQALAVGARGYLLKGNPYELSDAIRQVRAGDVYLSEPLRTSYG